MNDPALALLIKDVEEKICIVRREAMYDYIAPGGRPADARYSVTMRGDDLATSVEALLAQLKADEPKISENYELPAMSALKIMRIQVRSALLQGDILNVVQRYKLGQHNELRKFFKEYFYGHFGSMDLWQDAIEYDKKFRKYPSNLIDAVFGSLL